MTKESKHVKDDGELHLTSVYRLLSPLNWAILYVIAMVVNFIWLHSGILIIVCQVFAIFAIKRYLEDHAKPRG